MSKRFAEFLLREGYINPEHLQEADENFKAKKESYVLFLATKGYIDENRIAEVFSKRYGLTKLDLSKHQIKENIAELIPKELIFKYRVIPLQKNKNTLVVATYDPTVLAELDDLKFRLKMSLHAVITPVSSFFHALENNFSVGFGETFDEFADENNDVEELDGGTDYFDVTVASDGTDEDAPVIKFVNSMLANSVKKGASDIHLEPYEKAFRLRFRVDGELREITKIPPKMKAPVISRLKIMSKMDIGERRLPQDGRIKIRVGNKDVDFRVSSIPVQWGEKIVLRILDKAALQLDLKKLGFEKDQLLTFKN